MESVALSSLTDCIVLLTDGTQLGTLDNITLDTETGELEYLCIDPCSPDMGEFPRMENGQMVVPIDSVEVKQEYLLVHPPDETLSITTSQAQGTPTETQ
jgi:sporulation protein YlmC with PRC-barrel domain